VEVDTGKVILQKNGYSMLLPNEWIEIPPNIIEAFEKDLAKTIPGQSIQHNDCGFQLKSSKKWFEYPYILVQVKNTGRIPQSEFRKANISSFQKNIGNVQKNFISLISDLRAEEMFYDERSKIIWIQFESILKNIGPAVSIMGIIPTEKGFIIVTGNSLKDKYSIYKPMLQEFVASVRIDPWLKYKTKWSDSLPSFLREIDFGKTASKAIVSVMSTAIIGVIVLIISAWRKRRKG
jgi:hypothetical protein